MMPKMRWCTGVQACLMAGVLLVAGAAGASGLSVVNTMPGFLFEGGRSGGDVRTRLGAGQGGVSGPALLPVGVLATRRVRERTGLPVIGVGGIRTAEDVRQYLDAGADLVAVGTAALADPRCPERLVRAWERSATPGRHVRNGSNGV